MPRTRALTLRTESQVMEHVDHLAHDLGVSKNDVLNLLLRVGIQAGVTVALTASGIRQAEHTTGERGD